MKLYLEEVYEIKGVDTLVGWKWKEATAFEIWVRNGEADIVVCLLVCENTAKWYIYYL